MHKFEIRPDVLDAINKRRGGKLEVFPSIAPARTALVVIDLQRYFMEPGMRGEVPKARDIVPNVNRLAHALRAAGGQVVWVINNFDADIREKWSVMTEHVFTPERRDDMMIHLREGGTGQPLWPELETDDGDWHVDKQRFSALIQGSSDLDARLRGAGLDTVLIAGTLTNVCCESTARDAMMLNYKTLMVHDANATYTDEAHNAALNGLYQVFADVVSTDEAIARFSTAASAAAE